MNISHTKKVQRGYSKSTILGFLTLKNVQFSKIPQFLIVGCHKSVPQMCRYIIFNTVGYIHSINTFVRQKVCAHKRHRILAFFHTLFEKTQYDVPFVCTYFLSKNYAY